MTDRATPDDLPDALRAVLDAYRAAVAEPSHAALEEWTRRYPHYRDELTAFTVAWSLSDTLPTRPEVQRVTSEALLSRGLERVQQILAAQGQGPDVAASAAANPDMSSLSAEGTARGLSIQQLAERTGLSLVLLRMLDRRLIRFSSIPREAIDAIAAAIGREAGTVARYLQGAPTVAPGASYYAEHTPAVGDQDDFFDAVRDDPDLDDATRARWLSFEPQTREG